MDGYMLLKFLHILTIAGALGINLTYLPLIALGRRSGAPHYLFSLRAVRRLDRIAKPFYVLVLLTGLLLVHLGNHGWDSLWVVLSLLLFACVAVVGATVFAPNLTRQMAGAEAGDLAAPAHAVPARRTAWLFAVIHVLVIVILGLMVYRPTWT